MLTHTQNDQKMPSRVVILGAKGFVGKTSQDLLEKEGVKVLGLGRANIDLLADDAAEKIKAELKPEDSLVVISAEAPCKDTAMLVRNTQMMKAITDAIEPVQPAHVLYISSDAVYADSPDPLNEESRAQPDSLHGVMHLAREVMLMNTVKNGLAILRPTLIYGANDPHNGYGPNRFRRLAEKGEEIILFGEGEERRDHVYVQDVAELVKLILMHQSTGVLNAATGVVTSFREIAEKIAHGKVEVKGTERSGPMPHNGYRPFDPSATFKAFPSFQYTKLDEGLALSAK